ncbi:MAG TPA: histidine phosphatase family protein [Kofleriaceae bacterium]|nr:histidine phosphatase family protein [Kofleriaceae bacterium]
MYLVRHGVTAWHADKRVIGHRDVPLSEAGVAQGHEIAATLAHARITEVISSPLQRAIQTAEIIGKALHIDVARDPRLVDIPAGSLTGLPYSDVAASEAYRRFFADPHAAPMAGGESLSNIRDRAVAALDQCLEDSPAGDGICVVSHAGIIRVLLAHYLGAGPQSYRRLRVAPGSISVLEFSGRGEVCRVLAINFVSDLAKVIYG